MAILDAAEGNPALAAATEAILNRRLAASHGTGDQDGRRAAILLDALPDAAAALEAAEPAIIAAIRERLVAETADQVTAVAQETVLEAVAVSTARIAELEQQVALKIERLDLKPGDRVVIKFPIRLLPDAMTNVVDEVRQIFQIGPEVMIAISDPEVTVTTEPDPAAARAAELTAALADVLGRFVITSSGMSARVGRVQHERWQAIADGRWPESG